MADINDLVPVDDDAPTFNEQAFGSWGESASSDVPVLYLSTHVRLSQNLDRRESSLVESISPVREILDPTNLSFAELLQRDLEDFRVLNSLVPYLMGDRQGALGFFPPLLAVLLPFENGRPSAFPTAIETRGVDGNISTQDLTSGDFFRFRRGLNNAGSFNLKRRNAELQWNKDRARLVIIDGQHRAMALLAIYRSLAGDDRWKDRGAQYRHFYEDRIKKLYAAKGMPELEVPVTVCIFPTLTGGDPNEPFKRARTLFVDVNKEAKTPNRSRLILLSETDLCDIFTRTLLDSIRESRQADTPDFTLPLSAIEYDTPGAEGRDGRPIRGACITNIQHLHAVVHSVLWGPRAWVDEVASPKLTSKPTNEFMQKQLGLFQGNQTDWIFGGQVICPVKDVKRNSFPVDHVDDLREVFKKSWGDSLIYLFSNLFPFSYFGRVADKFEQDWTIVPDAPMALAKEAFFGGVGTYWTLRDMDRAWQIDLSTKPRELQAQMKAAPPPSTLAWQVIGQKEKEFELLVQAKIVGHEPLLESEKAAAREVLEKSQTQAMQRGIAMALASLVTRLGVAHDSIYEFTKLFVDRLNEYFLDSSNPHRRYFFSKLQPDGEDSLAFYVGPKLDSKKWVNMRWLVLEAFFSSPHDWSDSMTSLVPLSALDEAKSSLVPQVREAIRRTRIDEVLKAGQIKKADRNSPEATALIQQEDALIAERYKKWFGIDPTMPSDDHIEGVATIPPDELDDEDLDIDEDDLESVEDEEEAED